MGQGPIATYNQYAGGQKSVMNVTAVGVIKATPGSLYRISTLNGGTGAGGLLVADVAVYIAAQTITAITAAAQAVVTISTGG